MCCSPVCVLDRQMLSAQHSAMEVLRQAAATPLGAVLASSQCCLLTLLLPLLPLLLPPPDAAAPAASSPCCCVLHECQAGHADRLGHLVGQCEALQGDARLHQLRQTHTNNTRHATRQQCLSGKQTELRAGPAGSDCELRIQHTAWLSRVFTCPQHTRQGGV